jgi:hypothetical protein
MKGVIKFTTRKMMMNYTLAAMTLIRKSKKFDIVSGKQIDALAKFLQENGTKKFSWEEIISVVKDAK